MHSHAYVGFTNERFALQFSMYGQLQVTQFQSITVKKLPWQIPCGNVQDLPASHWLYSLLFAVPPRWLAYDCATKIMLHWTPMLSQYNCTVLLPETPTKNTRDPWFKGCPLNLTSDFRELGAGLFTSRDPKHLVNTHQLWESLYIRTASQDSRWDAILGLSSQFPMHPQDIFNKLCL